MTMYKDKKISLAKMMFHKDFTQKNCCGDMYPVLVSNGEYKESAGHGRYCFEGKNASVCRMFCRHFPYASYSLSVDSMDGECGFAFISPKSVEELLFCRKNGDTYAVYNGSMLSLPSGANSFTVTFCGKKADVYATVNGQIEYVGTFVIQGFAGIEYRSAYENTSVCLKVSGEACINSVESFIDCGVSQADIRPIRYENGEIMFENGKMFFTMSIRYQESGYQGVVSWLPGTAEFDLVGAIFYEVGDGRCCNDVASSVLYHRERKEWLIWVCSFANSHILGCGVAKGDIRYGINTVDITLMNSKLDAKDTEFYAKEGDEDPDFVYDEQRKVWRMIICRLVYENEKKSYRYFYFESKNPFDGYKFVSATESGEETGGNIVNIDGEYYLCCGNSFSLRANYRAYKLPNLSNYTNFSFDYDDGGFRGWGTIVPIYKGSRKIYYHLTFDRHKGSSYTWSYGNIYCFKYEE
jgi:hypothetical protein